jgi:hypothetical protein
MNARGGLSCHVLDMENAFPIKHVLVMKVTSEKAAD